LSSAVFALYLLDRVKKKYTVATLRFFTVTERAPQYQHRRKLQQPWSLVLQIVSLLLLLLAIAQLKLGSRDRASNDHVLVMDTSAWMAAQTDRGRLIDQARASAKSYLKALPASDRVMLVRADALPTPATQFETDRPMLQRAIDQTQPGSSVLNIQQALEFAQQAQKLHSQRSGDIAFVGAGRVLSDGNLPTTLPANLRMIPVNGPVENVGIRKLGLRRSLTKPDTWEIFAAVRNYGRTVRTVPLVIGFGGAPIGSRRFVLAPGAEETATFQYVTRSAGWLEARLLVKEAFTLDDRAVLELPERAVLPVTIYSDDPGNLKPIFNAIPNVKATYLPTAGYQAAVGDARIVVLDRFAPAQRPTVDSIWIQPPPASSPIAVGSSALKVKLSGWRSDSVLAAGLHTKDLELDKSEIFRPAAGDIALAESTAGPLIVAHPGKPKTLVFGFHPSLSAMKYELTTPLLFANIVRWMAPDLFTTYELNAGTVGTVNADLETEADPSTIRVITENQKRLPFTLEGKTLRFFSGSPGVVRVSTADRELVYSLTLPQAGDIVWKPGSVKTGIPRRADLSSGSRDIWQWLAILGALGLLVDWFLFGRANRSYVTTVPAAGNVAFRKAS
jgi:hypothetical protein